jgi:hypothetical protein
MPELHQKLSDMRTNSSANVHNLLVPDFYDDAVPATDEGNIPTLCLISSMLELRFEHILYLYMLHRELIEDAQK